MEEHPRRCKLINPLRESRNGEGEGPKKSAHEVHPTAIIHLTFEDDDDEDDEDDEDTTDVFFSWIDCVCLEPLRIRGPTATVCLESSNRDLMPFTVHDPPNPQFVKNLLFLFFELLTL